ncbi:MAG: hypothetical protein AAF501_01300 [Pseudomonadota bacterium]
MTPHPLRLILTSYLIAGLIAVTVPGIGLLGQVLTVWLGGSVLMFGLAVTPGISQYFRHAPDTATDDDAATEDRDGEFQRWDDDAALDHLNAEADLGAGAAALDEEPEHRTGTG